MGERFILEMIHIGKQSTYTIGRQEITSGTIQMLVSRNMQNGSHRAHAKADSYFSSSKLVTTKDGYLEITMSKQPTPGFDYQGGMLQSWNKLCFTGGFIEVSVSLPGTPQISGFWPG